MNEKSITIKTSNPEIWKYFQENLLDGFQDELPSEEFGSYTEDENGNVEIVLNQFPLDHDE